MRNSTTLIVCLLMITGCASVSPTVQPIVFPPSGAVVSCSDLPLISDGSVATLFRNHAEVARLYHDCRQRHDELIEFVKKDKNIIGN